jgi:hypothetical protein
MQERTQDLNPGQVHHRSSHSFQHRNTSHIPGVMFSYVSPKVHTSLRTSARIVSRLTTVTMSAFSMLGFHNVATHRLMYKDLLAAGGSLKTANLVYEAMSTIASQRRVDPIDVQRYHHPLQCSITFFWAVNGCKWLQNGKQFRLLDTRHDILSWVM